MLDFFFVEIRSLDAYIGPTYIPTCICNMDIYHYFFQHSNSTFFKDPNVSLIRELRQEIGRLRELLKSAQMVCNVTTTILYIFYLVALE